MPRTLDRRRDFSTLHPPVNGCMYGQGGRYFNTHGVETDIGTGEVAGGAPELAAAPRRATGPTKSAAERKAAGERLAEGRRRAAELRRQEAEQAQTSAQALQVKTPAGTKVHNFDAEAEQAGPPE